MRLWLINVYNILCDDRYDHEEDDEFERMQKAEAYILNRYTQFLTTHSSSSITTESSS